MRRIAYHKNVSTTHIAIPTYNEGENIGPLIREIFHYVPDVSVLVVDDDSPDKTGDAVRLLQREYPRLFLLERKGARGFAGAYLAAFDAIMQDPTVERIVTMDGDFSHHPRYISEILEAAEKCDLVIGSRYVSGGGVKNWNMRRRLLSKIGNLYARLVTGMPCQDTTAGFMCIRASLLKKIPWRSMRAQGYAWLIELKMLFSRAGASICEIPIIFEERRAGSSKISKSIIMEGVIQPIRMRFSK